MFVMDYKTLEKEKVSIIIPCYNLENYIAEAVLSIFNQTYKKIETIIVDDGSSDKSVEIIKELVRYYPNNQLKLVSWENQGVVKTRNYGASLASGEYLFFLDGDDVIRHDFIEKAVTVLKSNPACGFVYSDVQHIGSRSDVWSGGAFNPFKMLLENQLTISALLRKKIFDEVGGFKQILIEGYEDWEFWISCVEKGWSGFHINEPLFYYRKHSNESRLNTVDDELHKKLYKTIQELHPELYGSLKEFLSANNIEADLV